MASGIGWRMGSPQRQSIGSHRASCSRGIVPREMSRVSQLGRKSGTAFRHTRFEVAIDVLSRPVLVRDDSRHTHLPPASEHPRLGPRPTDPATTGTGRGVGELGTAHPSGHALDLCPPKRLSPSFYHARFASLMPRPTEPLAHGNLTDPLFCPADALASVHCLFNFISAQIRTSVVGQSCDSAHHRLQFHGPHESREEVVAG